jgi:hypothetical protein
MRGGEIENEGRSGAGRRTILSFASSTSACGAIFRICKGLDCSWTEMNVLEIINEGEVVQSWIDLAACKYRARQFEANCKCNVTRRNYPLNHDSPSVDSLAVSVLVLSGPAKWDG